jgi:hypothetical protein
VFYSSDAEVEIWTLFAEEIWTCVLEASVNIVCEEIWTYVLEATWIADGFCRGEATWTRALEASANIVCVGATWKSLDEEATLEEASASIDALEATVYAMVIWTADDDAVQARERAAFARQEMDYAKRHCSHFDSHSRWTAPPWVDS